MTHSTNDHSGFQFLRAWAIWGLLMPHWHVTIPAVLSRALIRPVRWWMTQWRGVDAHQILTLATKWPAALACCAAATTQGATHLQVLWLSVDANGKDENNSVWRNVYVMLITLFFIFLLLLCIKLAFCITACVKMDNFIVLKFAVSEIIFLHFRKKQQQKHIKQQNTEKVQTATFNTCI